MKWRRFIGHFGLFSISKSALLSAPFLAAYLFSVERYANLERSLASASLLAVVVSLGAAGVIAYSVVREQHYERVIAAFWYVLLLAVFAVAVGWGISFFSLSLSLSVGLTLLLTGGFVLQVSVAAYLKAKGFGAYASLVESGVYLSLLLFLLFFAFFTIDYRFIITFYLLVLMTATLAVCVFVIALKKRAQVVRVDRLAFLKNGFPMMLSAALAMFLLFFPRLFLGYFSSATDMANFSLLFRFAALSMVAHQFIVTFFFKEIFNVDLRRLDRVLAVVPAAVLLISLMLFGLLVGMRQWNVWELPNGYEILISGWRSPLLISACMFFWSLTALMEGVLFREGLALKQMSIALKGIVLMVGVLTMVALLSHEPEWLGLVLWAWLLGLVAVAVQQIKMIEERVFQECSAIWVRVVAGVVMVLFLPLGLF